MRAADGYVYERECLKKWLIISPTSPITYAPCEGAEPDHALKAAIGQFVERCRMWEEDG